jgi:hypothetical protein
MSLSLKTNVNSEGAKKINELYRLPAFQLLQHHEVQHS